jgi:tRNA(adenine34) deaminase
LLQDERLNHRVEMETGLLRDECEAMMKNFFIAVRKKEDIKL